MLNRHAPALHQTPLRPSQLQRLPEVIRIKEARELPIQVDDVDVAAAIVPHDGLGELAAAAAAPAAAAVLLVPLELDAQAAVDLEAQQDLVVDGVAAARGVLALDPLHLELLEPRRQVRLLRRQPLRLHLQVRRRLRGPELLRVEPRDLARVRRRRVRRHELLVLVVERVERAREFCRERKKRKVLLSVMRCWFPVHDVKENEEEKQCFYSMNELGGWWFFYGILLFALFRKERGQGLGDRKRSACV